MRNEFIDKIVELRSSGEAYATAQIVRRKTPSSGKPGDQAIITTDGKIHGWIGGGCTRGIVLKESIMSLNDGKPRLVSIRNNPAEQDFGNTKVYSMSCQSGGEVEVYIEPVLPKPKLVIMGSSHIGMALAKISKAMDYQVEVVMSKVDELVYPDADKIHALSSFSADEQNDSYVVVCTQGEGDMEAMAAGLKLNPKYLAFVSSRKKAQAIFTDLRGQGVTFDQLKKIITPAGIDLGAKLAEEVAISILAEIIKDFRGEKKEESNSDKMAIELPTDDFYMNPVCNIPISKSTAKYVLEHKGEKVYFCCDGCKVSFEKDPEKYIPA